MYQRLALRMSHRQSLLPNKGESEVSPGKIMPTWPRQNWRLGCARGSRATVHIGSCLTRGDEKTGGEGAEMGWDGRCEFMRAILAQLANQLTSSLQANAKRRTRSDRDSGMSLKNGRLASICGAALAPSDDREKFAILMLILSRTAP